MKRPTKPGPPPPPPIAASRKRQVPHPLLSNGSRFIVTVEAMPDSLPPLIRLRRFLKAALRGYRIRCISIETVRPETPVSSEGDR